jgi:c-di-GMP-binding flagellar brake protein YcgR
MEHGDPTDPSGTEAKAEGRNRRRSIRVASPQARVTLTWGEAHAPVTMKGNLIDLSSGGAAVLMDVAPPTDSPVTVALDSEAGVATIIRAQILECREHASGKAVVRLRFQDCVRLEKPREPARERRLWKRYPVKANRTMLFWQEGDQVEQLRAEMLNISGGGAAIAVAGTVPADQPVWICLEMDGSYTSRVEARQVATVQNASGKQVVRFQFSELCPLDLYEAAVHGPG